MSPHPTPSPIITLTTDFGDRDWYVATLKGVILTINPQARIVDNTHQVPAGNIQAGAYILKQLVAGFPSGTIHLAVVDPGVGSPRRPLIATAGKQLFVGPDNGLFDTILANSPDAQLIEITPSQYTRENPSCTFHGRDIFAPIAAHASLGLPPTEFGVPCTRETAPPEGVQESATNGSLKGKIVYVDHYGNAISNIPRPADWSPTKYRSIELPDLKKTIQTADYYAAVPPGELVAVVGSSGHLEVSLNQGNAARTLGLKVGDTIVLPKESLSTTS